MDINAAELRLASARLGRKNYYGSGSRLQIARQASGAVHDPADLGAQINPQRSELLSCNPAPNRPTGTRTQLRRFLPWEMDPVK